MLLSSSTLSTRRTAAAVGFVAVAGAAIFAARTLPPKHDVGSGTTGPSASSIASNAPEVTPMVDDDAAFAFRVPTGAAAELGCDDAKSVVRQVRTLLAYEPSKVPAKLFAESAADWLDPHALWSLPQEAPTAAALGAEATNILLEMEDKRSGCQASERVGSQLTRWVARLRGAFDTGRKDTAAGPERVGDAIPTEGDAMAVALELGRRAGAFERLVGEAATPYVEAARGRFFPDHDAEGWSHVVLAAGLRAYVPLVDAHGAWAPLDEEASIYEVSLAAKPPSKPWSHAQTSAFGAVIEAGAIAPFKNRDVVLDLAGVKTAGLSMEELEQLGFAAPVGAKATVLRGKQLVTVQLQRDAEPVAAAGEEEPVESETVAYGDGVVLRLAMHEVRDNMKELLSAKLTQGRREAGDKLRGVVLDLRDNGGGSTDGAVGALSLFLPDLPLFPTKRRDGTVEIDRTIEVAENERYSGPLVTFVGGATASAAEMIAGALSTYGRAPMMGTTTFGKGCEQEYIDDDARAGVLRLTTLLYALPDGTAVQRVGLSPQLRFPFRRKDDKTDTEGSFAHAPPTWKGPDVRPRGARSGGPEWPSAADVGPCSEADVCKALKQLGASQRRSATATARPVRPQ